MRVLVLQKGTQGTPSLGPERCDALDPEIPSCVNPRILSSGFGGLAFRVSPNSKTSLAKPQLLLEGCLGLLWGCMDDPSPEVEPHDSAITFTKLEWQPPCSLRFGLSALGLQGLRF